MAELLLRPEVDTAPTDQPDTKHEGIIEVSACRLTKPERISRIVINVVWKLMLQLMRRLDHALVDPRRVASQADLNGTARAVNKRVDLPCCVVMVAWRYQAFALKLYL